MNEEKRPADAYEIPWFERLVVAISLVVVAMLIRSTFERRRPAGRPQCVNNLRNLCVGVQNFASTNDGVLPPQSYGLNHLSWRVAILPLIDHAAMYREYHRDKPWDDPANLEFAKTKVHSFVCPNNPTPQDSLGRYYTAYSLLTGPGTAYDPELPQKWGELPKGSSNTPLLIEACGTNIVWNEPRDVDVDQYAIQVKMSADQVITTGGWESRQHQNEVNVAFADGSVRSLSLTIDHKVRKTLTDPQPRK